VPRTDVYYSRMDSCLQPSPAHWYGAVRMPLELRHEETTNALLDLIETNRASSRGVTAQHRENERQAVCWIIEALFQAWQHVPTLSLALPLKHEFYDTSNPFRVPLSHRAVNRVIKVAELHGWIRLVRGNNIRQEVTLIKPWGPMLRAFRSEQSQWCKFPATPAESLVVMTINRETGAKRQVEISEHQSVSQWRENLSNINSFLREQCIFLDMPDDEITKLGRRNSSKGSIWFANVELRRIFNGERLDYGGRFYGGWWQNVPSALRRHISINGDPIFEADFSAMAIRCLYARHGLLPPDDPYDVGYKFTDSDDPRRGLIKRYFNAALNDLRKRFRLSADELNLLAEKSMRSLKDRVLKHHPILEQWLHSGVGLELQFLESQIAERVMLSLIEHNITCLPIHDSFIVAARNKESLTHAMHAAFQHFTGKQAHLKSEPGSLTEGMWFLPEQEDQSEEEILAAWSHHTDKRHSTSMNYFLSWYTATNSPEQIDQIFHAAVTRFQDWKRLNN
jgi:hypothetical protein